MDVLTRLTELDTRPAEFSAVLLRRAGLVCGEVREMKSGDTEAVAYEEGGGLRKKVVAEDGDLVPRVLIGRTVASARCTPGLAVVDVPLAPP